MPRLSLPARPALAMLVGILSIGCDTSGGIASGVVRIGLAADPSRPNMLTVMRGMELAIEALNAEGGDDLRFELAKPPQGVTGAVEIAVALRDDPLVVGVVGPADSRSSRDAAPIYGDEDGDGARAVAAVSPTSTSVALSGISPWVFRVCPSDGASSRAAARYVLDSLGFRRATIMYRNDSYGRGWAAAFTEAFHAGGGTVLERNPHMADMNDWRAYAGVVQLTRPEIVLFPGSPGDLVAFVRATRAISADVPVLGGDAISELESQATEFAGLRYIAFFQASRARTPEAKAFVATFTKRYGTPPEQRSALSYDATMAIGRAAREVGPHRRRIRDFLAAIGSERPAMVGVTGAIAFDENRDVMNKPVVIATVGR